MLRFVSHDVVFQEVPGEVTLALNLSACPNRCKGCHSPHLQEATGRELDENLLSDLLEKYGKSCTCVCFMGGDAFPEEVERWSIFVREKSQGRLKTAWYSGKTNFPESCAISNFDYIKIGPYVEDLGGLSCESSNQRFFKVEAGEMMDMTYFFQR